MTAADERPLPLATSVADLLLEIGLDGLIAFSSPSVGVIAGYAVGELVGHEALDFVKVEDRRRVLRHFARVRRAVPGAALTPVALRLRLKDGRWIWHEGNPAPLRDPVSGEVVGWVDMLRGIEARKARERDLVVAREAAEAGAAAQAELLANMSHEIRTPLNSIIGFMQVLKRGGGLGETQLGHIARVEEAGRNLLTVVDDVLDLSKVESGVIRLNKRPFSPAVLVGDAAALIRPQAVEKHLSLVVDIAPAGMMTVIGDQDRLRQILLNLLSNAVKFTVMGEVRLRLEAGQVESSLDLAFVVEDSGMGIAPEQLPKLFRRYTQADGSIARRFGGTGLGLAISKRLIEAMGGLIDVESHLAFGSRFVARVRLPLATPKTRLKGTAATPRRAEHRRRDVLRDKRLLVADDVPMNQRLVEAMLEPLGCRIDVVADGVEALRAVQSEDYALVLMDMRMPVLDGAATARAIRALGGRFADLPIIGLTANIFPEDMDRAREAGMNEVVTKPIDVERLVSTVVAWAAARPPVAPRHRR